MKFTDEEIVIEPVHEGRKWQAHNYTANGVHLFHLRTYIPWSCFKQITEEAWLDCHGTKAQIIAIASRHGGHALEDFYPEDENNPGYFLAFDSEEKALVFCRTDDFDKLCLTMEKV